MLILTLLALAYNAPAQGGYWVKTVGVEAPSGHNTRQAALLVDTVLAEHLYAIGEPADGRGEIFVWDNAVFVAAVTPDTREPFVQRFVKNLQASYLLYANVPDWDTVLLYQPVRNLAELEVAIVEVAAGHGLDTAQAFPFLLIGKIKSGTGDIVFLDNRATDGKYVFPLLDKRAQMIGFHQGSGAGMRIHFRLQNKYHAGRLSAADFDESEPIRLFLPAKRPTTGSINIRVNDTDFSKGRLGNVQEVNLQDLTKFHGHLCDGLVEGFLALQYGLYRLYPDSVVDRTNTRIVSKPSPCLTDAAIFLTGARYQFNTFYVSQETDGLYTIQRIDDGQTVVVRRKPNVKPAEIDDLGYRAISGNLPPCDLDRLKVLEDAYMAYLLDTPVSSNFELVEMPAFDWAPVLKNDFIKTDVLNKNQRKCN